MVVAMACGVVIGAIFGLAFRMNRIILHGFTIKPNKMTKLIKYLELIEELY